MPKLNLDALILREDFEVEESQKQDSSKKTETVSIRDLEQNSFFFPLLRKPDFQRETSEWEPQKVCEFIKSFLDGDLIPALILWQGSKSRFIFVIDGSHRISALASWVYDDYGDNRKSQDFYESEISADQKKIAERARKLINKEIGKYSDYKLALTNPEKLNSKLVDRAKNLSTLAIQLQWVGGDAKNAEASFLKINKQAAPINPTELKLIESRKKPNCIAARAINRSGKGHKYWSGFSSEKQTTIQNLSKEINELLFSPELETPVKTLDIPIGGKKYSAQSLPLTLEFINIVNNLKPDFSKLTNDDSGDTTLEMLQKCKDIAYRINSIHPTSLGLHPIVYLYTKEGRHKTTSFFGTLLFIMRLSNEQLIAKFLSVREKFEELLLSYDYLIQQMGKKFKYSVKSVEHVCGFYFSIIDLLKEGKLKDEVISQLLSQEKYNYLKIQTEQKENSSNEFSREDKSAVYIKEALPGVPKCKICKGYIHKNSITIDHKIRKSDGGTAEIDNGQLAHPYCNTTFKN